MSTDAGGFVHLEDEDAAHPELAHWHGNIGEPVALDLSVPAAVTSSTIDVISWNVAIGLGHIEDVVNRLRAGELDGETRPLDRPLVLLLQEVYRSDASVPAQLNSRFHGGKVPREPRRDIVETAHALGFCLRYAPSMRNGRHRSDRGNAILSSVPIQSARYFTLPHVRQRRVVVAAELAGQPGLTFATAHLDTRGRLQGGAAGTASGYGAGRHAQASALAARLARQWPASQRVILGADLNTYLGTREPLLRALERAGFHRCPHHPLRSHTFHAPPVRLLLDHLLVRGTGLIDAVAVRRLDADARDRTRYIFGSDHHPLLARIALVAQNRP